METVSELSTLLKNMDPKLSDTKYFMASVDSSQLLALASYSSFLMDIFREEEGLSVVFSDEILDELKGLSEVDPVGPFALITLNVYSDLMAVGFLAKITDALAKEGISVNAFSAYHHDHLFVPYEKRELVLEILKKISN
ncbi:ACT domain-containing protein [Candidatus Micrarchaeota archaeon]|nr:ACT domain-containing protein [Candidatus Micrarchaeota archaeon]